MNKSVVNEKLYNCPNCPNCHGTGYEICNNPDHGFIDAIGVRGLGHANGCPVCGNDEYHRILSEPCDCKKFITEAEKKIGCN